MKYTKGVVAIAEVEEYVAIRLGVGMHTLGRAPGVSLVSLANIGLGATKQRGHIVLEERAPMEALNHRPDVLLKAIFRLRLVAQIAEK